MREALVCRKIKKNKNHNILIKNLGRTTPRHPQIAVFIILIKNLGQTSLATPK